MNAFIWPLFIKKQKLSFLRIATQNKSFSLNYTVPVTVRTLTPGSTIHSPVTVSCV